MVQSVKFGPKADQADFEPVYSLKGNLHQKRFRKFMRQALRSMQRIRFLKRCLLKLRSNINYLSIARSVRRVHFPKDANHVKQARRRFVYEECYMFQLRIQAFRKARKEHEKGIVIHYDLEKVKRIYY